MLKVLALFALTGCGKSVLTERQERAVQLTHAIYQVHPEGRSDVTCFILDGNSNAQTSPSMSCVSQVPVYREVR